MTNLPTPPPGWPTEPEHRPACNCQQHPQQHPQPVVYVPQRTGPSAGLVLAGAVGGSALLLTVAISAVAVAVCAVSIAVCALVCRWIIADMRKGK